MSEINSKYFRIFMYPSSFIYEHGHYPLPFNEKEYKDAYTNLIEQVRKGVCLESNDPRVNLDIYNSCSVGDHGNEYDKKIVISLTYPNVTTTPLSIQMTKGYAIYLVKKLIDEIANYNDNENNIPEIKPRVYNNEKAT